MEQYRKLSKVELMDVVGGKKHKVNWGKCALAVAGGEGLGALASGPAGAVFGAVSGAAAGCM